MTGCSVCIGGQDYDYSCEFYNERVICARKAHKCCECYREIPKGSPYQRIAGKWDGDFSTHSTCMDCANIRRGLSCEGEAWPAFGYLWDEVTDAFKNLVSTACLTKIPTASAKAYFLERWRKYKGLAA